MQVVPDWGQLFVLLERIATALEGIEQEGYGNCTNKYHRHD